MKALWLVCLVVFLNGCGGGKTPPKPKDEDDVGGASSQLSSTTTIEISTPETFVVISVRND